MLDTETLSSFGNGVYEVWTVSGHVKITVTNLAGPNAVLNGLFFAPTATATFVKTDTTTQGTWMGTYGADGYNVVGTTTKNPSYPSYATVTASGASTYTWSANTTDVRALQNPSGTGRIAAAWYASTHFTIDVNLTDGQAHQIALYALDWDQRGRSEKITITNASTGAVLSTETLSSFTGGAYEVWTISGHVKITITNLAGPNAVLSGLFFGTPTVSPSSTPAATAVGQDTGTQDMGITTSTTLATPAIGTLDSRSGYAGASLPALDYSTPTRELVHDMALEQL